MKKDLDALLAEIVKLDDENSLRDSDLTIKRLIKRTGWKSDKARQMMKKYAKQNNLKKVLALNSEGKYEAAWRA